MTCGQSRDTSNFLAKNYNHNIPFLQTEEHNGGTKALAVNYCGSRLRIVTLEPVRDCDFSVRA